MADTLAGATPGATLVTRLVEPYNASAPLGELGRHYLTPVSLFYVRSHGNVPAIDVGSYRLSVEGDVEHPLTLSLSELHEAFGHARERHVATIQCAGNRRSGLSSVAPTRSPLQWDADAIGTTSWSGFPLRALLDAAGVRGGAHVAFEAADVCATPEGDAAFGASIPLWVALSAGVVLADRMGDEPLQRVHGAPLRVVVPGHIGARSVKWLRRIIVQDEESANWYQRRDYRLDGVALGATPLNSAITEPAAGASVPAGTLRVRGWAIARSGRRVERVEVSADGGGRWSEATNEGGAEPHAWRLWEAAVDVGPGSLDLVARAWDSAGEGQPQHAASIWNAEGYMNNAWDRVTVTARP